MFSLPPPHSVGTCVSPRLEFLGVLSAAAAPSPNEALSASPSPQLPASPDWHGWSYLRGRRAALTASSALLFCGAVDALACALCRRAGPATSTLSLVAQYSSGVLVLAPAGFDAGGGFADGAPLRAAKAGLTENRLLLLTVDAAAVIGRVGAASAAAALLAGSPLQPGGGGGGGGGGDDDADVAAAAHLACHLDSFLSWLRAMLGGFRATLSAGAAGAPSPSVVARISLSAGGGGIVVECSAVDAPGAPLLLAPPSTLRGMLAAAAPPASAAASAAAPAASAGAKRARSEMESWSAAAAAAAPSSFSSSSSSSVAATPGVSLAVIVPYRSQPLQNREAQLARFAAHMPAFLSAAGLRDFHVIVVEQSDDGLKFNRGKALNAGFAIATDAARHGLAGAPFSAFCFHDVDLLPQPPLAPWYARAPAQPLHIAGAWPRYAAQNEAYIGGVTTMSAAHFSRVNGFPNNFWGWGGEDDELRHRLQAAGLYPPLRPPAALSGSILDTEEELCRTVGGERASTRLADGGRTEWRCMWKKELRAYHVRTGHVNGLRTLHFRLLRRRSLGERVTVFTVDLLGGVDVAAQMDDQNAGIKVSAQTTAWLIDEMLRLETAPGTGEMRSSEDAADNRLRYAEPAPVPAATVAAEAPPAALAAAAAPAAAP